MPKFVTKFRYLSVALPAKAVVHGYATLTVFRRGQPIEGPPLPIDSLLPDLKTLERT